MKLKNKNWGKIREKALVCICMLLVCLLVWCFSHDPRNIAFDHTPFHMPFRLLPSPHSTNLLSINRRLCASEWQQRLACALNRNPFFYIQSTESILKTIDQKKVTAVILLDMSKASDSINLNILLAKLEEVGVSSTYLNWFKNHLSDRYQAVRINSSLSEKLPVASGVLQGRILGPLLFSIYMSMIYRLPLK